MNNNKLIPVTALEESSIINSWGSNNLYLSVVCRTYNHEKYIRSAIDSILGQKTEYKYEILVFDDGSIDNTHKILREYQVRYPSIVKLFLFTENRSYEGSRFYPHYIRPHVLAPYTCICDGDDFWTDPLKIQKQIEFLSKNAKYVACTHNVITIDENNNVINVNHFPPHYRKNFTQLEVKQCWAEPLTQSVIYRNEIDYPAEFDKSQLGDVFRGSLLGTKGEIAYINDITPSAYRLHNSGIFSSLERTEKYDAQILTFFWLSKYYRRLNDVETASFFRRRYMEKAIRQLSAKEIFKLLWIRFFKANPKKWL